MDRKPVRIEADVVEQEPERDQVQLHRSRLVLRGQLRHPGRDLVDAAGLRLRLPRSATKRDQARWVYLPE